MNGSLAHLRQLFDRDELVRLVRLVDRSGPQTTAGRSCAVAERRRPRCRRRPCCVWRCARQGTWPIHEEGVARVSRRIRTGFPIEAGRRAIDALHLRPGASRTSCLDAVRPARRRRPRQGAELELETAVRGTMLSAVPPSTRYGPSKVGHGSRSGRTDRRPPSRGHGADAAIARAAYSTALTALRRQRGMAFQAVAPTPGSCVCPCARSRFACRSARRRCT